MKNLKFLIVLFLFFSFSLLSFHVHSEIDHEDPLCTLCVYQDSVFDGGVAFDLKTDFVFYDGEFFSFGCFFESDFNFLNASRPPPVLS